MEAATSPRSSTETPSSEKGQTSQKPSPPTPSESKAEERITHYDVLAAPEEEGPYTHVGTFQIDGNGGQQAARKKAFQHTTQLQERVRKGETVFLAAVPASSWKPTPVTLEQREPKLNI